MSKELYIAAHEQLIEEYLLEHPEAEWGEAYEITADSAFNRMRESLADMIDALEYRT